MQLGLEQEGLRSSSGLIDARALDEVAAKLREIERQSGLERTLEIGQLILTRFYGGSASVWTEHRRNKWSSVRKLAQRPDCPYGKSAISEAVRIYIATSAMPSVRTLGHISSTHVAIALRLAPERQEGILKRANDERWGIRRLKREVAAINRALGEHRGRQPSDMVAQLRNLVDGCSNRMSAAREFLRQQGRLLEVDAELERVQSALTSVMARLEGISRKRAVRLVCTAETLLLEA